MVCVETLEQKKADYLSIVYNQDVFWNSELL